MEKNNTSSSSMCTKIRQALTSNPAVRAIQRISSFNQEPKHVTNGPNSPSSPAKNSSIQTKPPDPPHPPQHHKAHTETSGAIPIKIDYSTPIENGNSSVSSGAKGASALVGNSERATKVAAKGTKSQPQYEHVPMQGKPPTKAGAQHGHHGVHSEQQGKKSMDINETFDDFIKRVKDKMRSVSSIGRSQSNPAAAPEHEVHGTNKNESHKDHFLDFINRAKKKIRTTTTVGKTGSLRRE